jgi:hypothetical protein
MVKQTKKVYISIHEYTKNKAKYTYFFEVCILKKCQQTPVYREKKNRVYQVYICYKLIYRRESSAYAGITSVTTVTRQAQALDSPVYGKKIRRRMPHNYQKRWVFTWNADNFGGLPPRQNLIDLLNEIAVEGVFQTEAGLKTGRPHYQGRFVLKGQRLGKKRLLEIFKKVGEITNLTFDQELTYDSTKYCTKDETRKAGPFFVGTDSYRQKMTPMQIQLNQWQKELLREIKLVDNADNRDRKVFWIEDPNGGAGKSTFSKYLSFGQKDWKVKKLPIENPSRIRMAVCKILQKEDVDMFTFDFTRTMGEETSMNNLFQVVEELKNGHIVSVLYGNPMEVAMTSPHVVIFTNEKFEDYEKYLSKDRWMAYVISPDQCLARRVWHSDRQQWVFVPLSVLNTKK